MRRSVILFFVFILLLASGTSSYALTTEELDEMIRREVSGGVAAPGAKADVQAPKSAVVSADAPAATGIVDCCGALPAGDAMQGVSADVPQTSAAVQPKPADEVKLPEVYNKALALIKSDALRNDVQYESMRWFTEGRRDKAASVIGHAVGKENNFSLFCLGRFCLDTLPAAGSVDAQAEFLTGFMRGYSGSGILMFTTYGLKAFKAYPMSRGTPWLKVPSGAASAAKDERIFIGKGVAFIPFKYGTKFKLDVTANGGHSLTVWKILPEGANVKSWDAGVWEKEITVRGDIKY